MKHARTIYLFVNGIATWPGNFTNWNKRAVTFTHTHTSARAEAFEYFCTALTRPFREDQRARHFARALRTYSKLGWDIICVGHSNGCAVILEGLRQAQWPRVKAVHLVCGACESDFSKNGLNSALAQDRIGHVMVYCAEHDLALPLAHSLIGKMLGYGSLGMDGAIHVADPVEKRVGQLWWKHYGHSSCWLPENFHRTMLHFFDKEFIDVHSEMDGHYGGQHLLSRHD
ncbi:MAG TPA: hypothetical protein VGO57_02240 [Verrucomicrobiae bacterium]|jgi:pimeloyl-ACP methyl ester carboxylesterase